MNITRVRAIYAYVWDHDYGGFLHSFADAVIRADGGNSKIIQPVAEQFIEMYSLEKDYDKYIGGVMREKRDDAMESAEHTKVKE